MPRWLPPAVFLAAVAAVLWLALGSRDGAHDAPGPAWPSRARVPIDAPQDLRAEQAPTLHGTPADARGREPTWPVVPSNEIPRGGLDVVVLGPDLERLASKHLRVDLERLGAGFWAQPLAVFDRETRTWSFRNVPWGRVRVRVVGDHVLETTKEAGVPKNEVASIEIGVDLGGAIHYRALLLDGKPPASVTLRLVSTETREPVEARYQARGAELTQDRPAREITQAAEGVVFGIPPGEYVLHATSAEGDRDQVAVTVEAGKTVEVAFQLRF